MSTIIFDCDVTEFDIIPKKENYENMDESGNSSFEYASDHWGETLNYMSDDEIEQIHDFENKEEVDDYLRFFYERT